MLSHFCDSKKEVTLLLPSLNVHEIIQTPGKGVTNFIIDCFLSHVKHRLLHRGARLACNCPVVYMRSFRHLEKLGHQFHDRNSFLNEVTNVWIKTVSKM